MDNHSRSASPRDQSAPRPQHRPPSPPPTTPSSFDNKAYQHDEDLNHNDSFTSQQQNGHTKDQNGTQTKTPEAVNLELINLTPKNGSKKKDVEVDMNATNPYDEYFVPVNEHRKYMRGEKLYVTADKRGEKGSCKRPLCWTLLALITAVIVAVIALAATGILFTNSPKPLDRYNSSSISSARAFGGLGGGVENSDENYHSTHHHSTQEHDHSTYDQDHSTHDQDHSTHDQDHSPHDHDHNTHDSNHNGQEQYQGAYDHIVPTPEPSPKQVKIMTTLTKPTFTMPDESSDVTLYVPRTVEGELTIDNIEFMDQLRDPESQEFRMFNEDFADALKKALFDRETLEKSNHDINVQIISIKPGSLVVTYRIHWVPKVSSEVNEELLTAKSLQVTLDNYLNKNSRMINVYHVAEDKTTARQVLDQCHLNKNDCAYGCVFDETTLDFMCTCPRGQILDMTNSKKCMSILESNVGTKSVEDTKQKEYKLLNIGSEETKTKQFPMEEKRKDNFDWKSSQEVVETTTTDSEADFKYSQIFGTHSEGDDALNILPSAETEPNTESKQEAGPPGRLEPVPVTHPKPSAEPEPSTHLETKPSVQHENSAEAEPTAEPQPSAEPVPSTEPEPSTESEPSPQAEVTTITQPSVQPEPSPEPEPSAEPEPSPEPQSSAEPEPAAEPVPTTESDSQLSLMSKLIGHNSELKLETENSEAGSTTEPEPSAEPTTEFKVEHEIHVPRHFILTSETTTKSELENKNSPLWEYKYVTESFLPVAEAETTTKVEPLTESVANSIKNKDHEIQQIHVTQSFNSEETSTVAFSINYTTKTDPEEVRPDVFSIYEHLNHPSSNSGEKEHKNKDTNLSNNKNTITSTDSYFGAEDFINDNFKPTTTKVNQEQSTKSSNAASPETTITRSISITTPQTTENDEDISFDLITKQHEGPNVMKMEKGDEEEATMKQNENVENKSMVKTKKTPLMPIMTILGNEGEEVRRTYNIIRSNQTQSRNMSLDNNLDIVLKIKNMSLESDPSKISEETMDNRNINNETRTESEFDKTLNSVIEEATFVNITSTMLPKHEETTVTMKLPATTTEYSLFREHKPDHAQSIVEYLEMKPNTTEVPTTTQKPTTEVTEITFDVLNTFMNRSSKSIENAINATNVFTETTTELSPFTTQSDWLVENVSEVNYKDMIIESKNEKHTTTEQSLIKIEEIMKKGYAKDDFEPDYLNMPTKGPEQEVPLYGMIHDYDSEDARVKRVNTIKDITVVKGSTDSNSTISENSFTVPKSSAANEQSETNTTETISTESNLFTLDSDVATNMSVIELDKSLSLNTSFQDEQVESTTISTYIFKEVAKIGDRPAPVWETEEEIITKMPMTSTSQDNILSEHKEAEEEGPNKSATPVNNLNVTIYEVPGHNDSFSGTKSSIHLTEYEDHETEMNPFLPEVENNKSLVKKLQEGHDIIEPITVNDTQNENPEEHTTKDNFATTMNGPQQNSKNNEEDSTYDFNELNNENDNTHEIDPNSNSEANSRDDEKQKYSKIRQGSTFLQDTDDLDMKKMSETSEITTIDPEMEVTISTMSSDDGDYLSVVPISEDKREEKESFKKTFINDGIQLNDISDSPKKSDRRTLDNSKLDSVINNEA